MSNIIERVEVELKNRLVAAKFGPITLTMKCNNDQVKIIPCGYGDITSIEDIEYYLVRCDLPWSGADNLEKLSKFLVNYQKELDSVEEDKKKLRAYYNKHKNEPLSDWFEFYSDWHKELYGYRPR